MLLYTSYRKIYYWWNCWHLLYETRLLLPSRRLSVFSCLKTRWIFTMWMKFLQTLSVSNWVMSAFLGHESFIHPISVENQASVGSCDGSRGLSLLAQMGQVNWKQGYIFKIPFYICAVEKKKASISSAKQIKWRSSVKQGLFLVGRITMADNWNYELVGLEGD